MPDEQHRTLVASPTDAGRTVVARLRDETGLSHSTLRGIVDAGGVHRNGRIVRRPDERLEAGDALEVRWHEGRRYRPEPRVLQGEGFSVIHEDADLVVVDKEPGLITVPAPRHRGESLQERLEDGYRRRGLRRTGAEVVHRIDRFTSGLVVFARHARARDALKAQFAQGSPERVYLAVAEGHVEPPRGRLVHWLSENVKSLKVHAVPESAGGQRAACTYRVRGRYEDATYVEVRLETGRRNQIRVQLAETGHPLVGDLRYGRASRLIERTALHAWRLGFEHPGTGLPVAYEAPLPADFRRLLARLRRGARAAEAADGAEALAGRPPRVRK